MAKFKSVKFKGKSSLFKTLGLLALIIFTFYFIYNYLATGSFSLKPRASEVVVNDVNSCSQLLTDVDCNKLSSRGCSWVVGPSTTKTETVPNYVGYDCTQANCTTGAHGCAFTTTTKITGYTNQPIYECEQAGLNQSKCKQLGFEWISTGKTTKTPITQTVKTCEGSWVESTTKTVVTTVPGVGSCTGTLDSCGPNLSLSCQSTGSTVIDPIESYRCNKGNVKVACCLPGFAICKKDNRCVLESRLAECEGLGNAIVTKPSTPKPTLKLTSSLAVPNRRYLCKNANGKISYFDFKQFKNVILDYVEEDRSSICNFGDKTQNGCSQTEKFNNLWRICEPAFGICSNLGMYGECDVQSNITQSYKASSKYTKIVCNPYGEEGGNKLCREKTGDSHFVCDQWGKFPGFCIYVNN